MISHSLSDQHVLLPAMISQVGFPFSQLSALDFFLVCFMSETAFIYLVKTIDLLFDQKLAALI